jgi:hypothetical protein
MVLARMAKRDSSVRLIDVVGLLRGQSICKDIFSTILLVTLLARDAGRTSREEICSVRTLFLVPMSGKPKWAWTLHVHPLFHSRYTQK